MESLTEHLLRRIQIVGFLAAGLVFATSIINALVYSTSGAEEASAAGFILLAMVAVSLRKLSYAYPCLTVNRLYGYSILDPPPRPPTVVTSTPLHFTKSSAVQRETADL